MLHEEGNQAGAFLPGLAKGMVLEGSVKEKVERTHKSLSFSL